MYKQTLYSIIEPIKINTIKRLNKAKKWKYGYNKEHDVIVISKTGMIGEIYEIQNLKIALPKQPKQVFKGNDNGSTITPFTLDMSDGGKAKFEGGVSGSFEGDGSGLTGITASPFVTTPLSLTSNFTTTANTLNVLKSLASDPFTVEDGVTLTITATSIVEVEEV